MVLIYGVLKIYIICARCDVIDVCVISCTHMYYLHRLFPKCKFGDRCRFIHPICKFNAQLVNVLVCVYTGCDVV